MKKTILIADDELYIRLLVSSTLARDYSVLEASNGEEVINLAHSQRPDLILMDIMMPKLDGIGACYLLKSDKETRRIPIIMLSARTDAFDQDYSKDMGADGYMTKPINCQTLLDRVNHTIN